MQIVSSTALLTPRLLHPKESALKGWEPVYGTVYLLPRVTASAAHVARLSSAKEPNE
jgi:hypothetical protein